MECGPDGCLSSMTGLSRVRAGVRGFLLGAPPDPVADALLVVDELVTNALEHGDSPVRLRLQAREGGTRLWVEVYDGGSELPRVRTPDGHGLRVVDKVSNGWGAVPGDTGKTVWVELPLSEAP